MFSSNTSVGTESTEMSSKNATIAKVRATLGREATIKCQAESLVDQKMVSENVEGYELMVSIH